MLTSTYWDARYSVGDPVLDNQHRKLLSLCAQVANLMGDDSPEGVEEFHIVLNDLMAYAASHFRTEETLLGKCGYPRLDEQIEEHQEYERHLTDFLYSAACGFCNIAGLHQFLSAWWIHHILESDMAYSGHLRACQRPD